VGRSLQAGCDQSGLRNGWIAGQGGGMQWSDFLAQDCIFWLYEITKHQHDGLPR
jgi:hypothetical protein